MRILCLGAALLGCATSPPRAPSARAGERHAVIVSIDGLMPDSYTAPDRLGLAVPTLRALAAAGLVSPGARPVFPTVTYPNHTSIATGVPPAIHGIVGNEVFDPEEKNQAGWHWYAEEIRVATLWDAAAARGLTTLLVGWPVTVGARATTLMPEIWRSGTADDQRLLRALSTPGILDAAQARHPDLWTKLTPPSYRDSGNVDVAVTHIAALRPHLTMVHIFEVDDAEHQQGPGSAAAHAAIEHADAQLARVIAAVRDAGMAASTMIVVASDHGFLPVAQSLRVSTLLRRAGYLEVDPDGKVRSWRAAALVNGGSAYIYLRDAADAALGREVAALFAGLAATPGSGVGRVLDGAELRARGGDPRALLAIEAADGWAFRSGTAEPAVSPHESRGAHGHGDDRAELRASLIIVAPGVAPRRIEGAGLIDVAPTVAEWLGLPLPAATGRSWLRW